MFGIKGKRQLNQDASGERGSELTCDIRDVAHRLIALYPGSNELSESLLLRYLYLCEWKHTLENAHPMTKERWFLGHHGVFLNPDPFSDLRPDSALKIRNRSDFTGRDKRCIGLKDPHCSLPEVSSEHHMTVMFVISAVSRKDYSQLSTLVQSTYPVSMGSRHKAIDFQLCAEHYRQFCSSSI